MTIIILKFKAHKIIFEIKNNSWLRDQAWFFYFTFLYLLPWDAMTHAPFCNDVWCQYRGHKFTIICAIDLFHEFATRLSSDSV